MKSFSDIVAGRENKKKFNTLRTGLSNCLNALSRDLIQSEVRFL